MTSPLQLIGDRPYGKAATLARRRAAAEHEARTVATRACIDREVRDHLARNPRAHHLDDTSHLYRYRVETVIDVLYALHLAGHTDATQAAAPAVAATLLGPRLLHAAETDLAATTEHTRPTAAPQEPHQ